MNKKVLHAAVSALLLFLLMPVLCSCSRNSDAAESVASVSNGAFVSTAEPGDLPETAVGTAEKLSDEQVLSAIRNYCYISNPDLENIVNAGKYPVYWEISSGDEQEIVVLFRSYTGAQNRYYIDRTTGDTYVTEFVPGITTEEQQTEESFNVRDYFSAD